VPTAQTGKRLLRMLKGNEISVAFERVIAEQQEKIDKLTVRAERLTKDVIRQVQLNQDLAMACFGVIDNSTCDDYVTILRDNVREQGYCLNCREISCVCDE